MSVHAASPGEAARTSRLIEWVLRVREIGIIGALALLVTVTAILEPRFIEADSLRNLALNASIFAILAVGQTLVIITRNVDLSVGSVLGLSAFLAGDLLSKHPGMSLPLVFVLGIGLGAACGLFNGILVTWGQVPALVVTLGTLYAFRGLAFLWTDGRQVNAETLPDSFLNLGSDSIAGVPILVIIAVVVVLAVGQWLRDYRPGRELYAIGSNPEGARLAGVRGPTARAGRLRAGGRARRPRRGAVHRALRHGRCDRRGGLRADRDRRGRRRRRGDLRRHRQRLRRRARRPAAGHDHLVADRAARGGLLAAGGHRRAAAARDQPRPAARGTSRSRPAPQERAPCRLRPPRPSRRRRRAGRVGRARLAAACSAAGRCCSSGCCVVTAIAGAGDLARVPDGRLVHHRLARPRRRSR